MKSIRVALGKLEMLEKQLSGIEHEVSRCRAWVEGAKLAIKDIENEANKNLDEFQSRVWGG
jgi:hypothetical protein